MCIIMHYIYTYIYLSLSLYIYTYMLFMCIYTNITIYIYTYIHTYIHIYYTHPLGERRPARKERATWCPRFPPVQRVLDIIVH